MKNKEKTVEKCYVRTFRFADGEELIFHSICDGKDYSNVASVLGKLTDEFVSRQKGSIVLLEVSEKNHYLEGNKK